ncbi:MAG: CDP-alcohol phosphatidyltransferase family protein [Verrucomicrobia bacterium]|nr:CDP-alcohol phosphatidyltransferase family protein [Verrucomicrobiota bacterium]
MVTLPNLLSGVRLLLVPVLLWLAWIGHARIFFGCLIVSILTDAFDGLLARRLHQITELGAKLDSWADFATWCSLPLCGWWLRPQILRDEAVFLCAGLSLYFIAVLVGFLKFKRLTNYHTWGGKLSAIAVAAAVIVFFAGGPGWPFRIAMPIVMLASLEEIVITLILPARRANIPSVWHALRIRKTTPASEVAD